MWLVKREVYGSKVATSGELLARISDAAAAACIKKHGEQPRRRTRDLRTRVAKCVEVDGGILERLLRTVTDLSLKHQL